MSARKLSWWKRTPSYVYPPSRSCPKTVIVSEDRDRVRRPWSCLKTASVRRPCQGLEKFRLIVNIFLDGLIVCKQQSNWIVKKKLTFFVQPRISSKITCSPESYYFNDDVSVWMPQPLSSQMAIWPKCSCIFRQNVLRQRALQHSILPFPRPYPSDTVACSECATN